MKTIETAQLKEMKQRDEDFTLVNVLPQDQFDAEHIPGSQNAPVGRDDFEETVRRLSAGRPVVVYCSSEDCDASPTAARKLEQAGFSPVYDYEAGMRGWKAASLPVESSR